MITQSKFLNGNSAKDVWSFGVGGVFEIGRGFLDTRLETGVVRSFGAMHVLQDMFT